MRHMLKYYSLRDEEGQNEQPDNVVGKDLLGRTFKSSRPARRDASGSSSQNQPSVKPIILPPSQQSIPNDLPCEEVENLEDDSNLIGSLFGPSIEKSANVPGPTMYQQLLISSNPSQAMQTHLQPSIQIGPIPPMLDPNFRPCFSSSVVKTNQTSKKQKKSVGHS
ncbi:hypothetical protein DH2020_011998 [Rehmannia glutinosa]|uniref:Uncharacterized protein n=1 Tax=Rehmannia glutinosa TaxID=99300 RepID=A0ABR0XEZ5_REHGL